MIDTSKECFGFSNPKSEVILFTAEITEGIVLDLMPASCKYPMKHAIPPGEMATSVHSLF